MLNSYANQSTATSGVIFLLNIWYLLSKYSNFLCYATTKFINDVT